MFFEYDRTALSVARIHHRDHLQQEQRDRLARHVGTGTRQAPDHHEARASLALVPERQGTRVTKGHACQSAFSHWPSP